MSNIRHFLFGTLRGRLILSVATVHAVMMTLFIVDLNNKQRAIMLDRQEEEANAFAQTLAVSSANWIISLDIAGLQEIVDAQSGYSELLFAILSDEQGHILAHTDQSKKGLFLTDLPTKKQATVICKTPGLIDVAVPVVIGDKQVGWARVGIGQKVWEQKMNENTRDGLFYALLAIIIGSLIAWIMGYRITRRLYVVQDTMNLVRSGNYAARTKLSGTDEPAKLANTFDAMLDILDESEYRFKKMFNLLPIPICIFNKEEVLVDSNIRFEQTFGYSLKDVSTLKEWYQLAYPNPEYRKWVIAKWESAIKNAIENNTDIEPIEYQVTCKNGDVRTIIISGIIIKDDLLVTFIDISQRKQIESKLRETSQKFEAIIAASPDGIGMASLDGKIQLLSKQMAFMYGYSADEIEGLVGKSFFDFIDPSSHEMLNDNVKKLLAGEKKSKLSEYKAIRKDGSRFYIDVNSAVLFDSTGNPENILFVERDITNWKIAEGELLAAKERAEESENRLLTFINAIPDIVCYKDGNGRWLLANQADLELFHLTNVEYFGKTDMELAKYTPEIYNDTFQMCIHSDEMAWQKGTISNGIEIIPLVSGKNKIYDVFKIPLVYPDGKRKGLAVIGRDITELQETQETLIKAKEHAEQSDRLKSAFLTNMSHEIRTPMNGILGFSELLKQPELTGEEQQEYIKIIEKSGARMLDIINDIVDISKIESGLIEVDLKDSNINEQIDYIYAFFKPEMDSKGIQFFSKKYLYKEEAVINTDGEKICAILTNLVKNAIKYTDEGSIEFGYNLKMENQIKVLEFFVKDTGIGIPKDRQEAIFERFIQADISDRMARQGAGLGLSISKAYVEMLHGKVWVESEEGIGSIFYFTLPYNAEPEGKNGVEKVISSQGKENLINPEASGLKILIAEDDETSEMLITIEVDKFGGEILKARNGLESVEVCRNNPDIDLILMDIQMPLINGYEATQQIRQFNKNVVIIAQTAFALIGDREKAIEAGCNDYISKPINKDKLLALIQKYLKK